MKKILISLVIVCVGLCFARPGFGLPLFSFTIIAPDLQTADPSVPLTYIFTATNPSATSSVSLIGAAFGTVPPTVGTFALSAFTGGLSFGTPFILLLPGASITADFGTFTFTDPFAPVGTVQGLVFSMVGFAAPFTVETNFASASATVVPEPATLILMSLGLAGLAARFRKKYRQG